MEACGACAEVVGKGLKVGKGVMNGASEADAAVGVGAHGQLEV